jgi:hypothetical protein
MTVAVVLGAQREGAGAVQPGGDAPTRELSAEMKKAGKVARARIYPAKRHDPAAATDSV